MSVCVSSSSAGVIGGVVGGMSIPLGMSSMMHPLSHQMQSSMIPSMIPNGVVIGGGLTTNGIIDHGSTMGATPSENQDHPNPDMLLALIARNKALEGELAIININYDLLNKQIWNFGNMLRDVKLRG